MKTTDLNISQATLEALIERYFEAETSEFEEECLRQLLAGGNYRLTRPVQEAMAVMSLCAKQRIGSRRPKRTAARWAAVAASIAVLAAVGIALPKAQQPQPDVCVAYITGVEVNDSEAVMSIIQSDLECMSQAAQSVEIDNQLNDFKDIIQ